MNAMIVIKLGLCQILHISGTAILKVGLKEANALTITKP